MKISISHIEQILRSDHKKEVSLTSNKRSHFSSHKKFRFEIIITIMAFLKNIIVAALALNLPTGSEGNPYVISDDRVRNLDVTPVLGRGYSVMTNSFQSTCLDVKETTIPSFNYECE